MIDFQSQNQRKDMSKEYLFELAEQLEKAPRMGNQRDIPEGSCYIKMSDTLVKKIIQRLREIIGD